MMVNLRWWIIDGGETLTYLSLRLAMIQGSLADSPSGTVTLVGVVRSKVGKFSKSSAEMNNRMQNAPTV